jgi:hypothetical protein
MTQPATKLIRGRAASPVRTGLFIKQHLSTVGEDYPANIHRHLKEALKASNYKRTPTYHSFLRYFHHLISFGLVEFTGREEALKFDKGQNVPALLQLRSNPPRVVNAVVRYYRLTEAGKADDEAWHDPAGTRIRRGKYA